MPSVAIALLIGFAFGRYGRPCARTSKGSSRSGSTSLPPRRAAWVKVKNRTYWRYDLEREGAFRRRTATLAAMN